MARQIWYYRELEVIGYGGEMGSADHPFVFPGLLYAVKGRDIVLIPPYEESLVDVLCKEGGYTRREFSNMVVVGDATAFRKPIPARPKHVLWVNEGDGSPESVEYLHAAECLKRLIAFADEHRAEGDKLFRAGSHQAALNEYFRTATVSQEAHDFARVLLADPKVAVCQDCRKWIAELGHDPEALCAQIMEEITG